MGFMTKSLCGWQVGTFHHVLPREEHSATARERACKGAAEVMRTRFPEEPEFFVMSWWD
jgi:hypothetical protein